jgi:hypothetical protein
MTSSMRALGFRAWDLGSRVCVEDLDHVRGKSSRGRQRRRRSGGGRRVGLRLGRLFSLGRVGRLVVALFHD